MKFRPNIGSADFDVKVRHVRRFLEAGERVKVTVMFRGREMARPERGELLIGRIADQVADVARHDPPHQAGRDLTTVFTPKGRRDGGAGVRIRPGGPPRLSGQIRAGGGGTSDRPAWVIHAPPTDPPCSVRSNASAV